MLPITARVIWSDVLLYKHDKYLFIPPHLAAEYCFGPGQWALTIFLIAMKGHNRNYFLKSLFIFCHFGDIIKYVEAVFIEPAVLSCTRYPNL